MNVSFMSRWDKKQGWASQAQSTKLPASMSTTPSANTATPASQQPQHSHSPSKSSNRTSADTFTHSGHSTLVGDRDKLVAFPDPEISDDSPGILKHSLDSHETFNVLLSPPQVSPQNPSTPQNPQKQGLFSALRGKIRQFSSSQKKFEKNSNPKPRQPSNTERFEAESLKRNTNLVRSVTINEPAPRRPGPSMRLPLRERVHTTIGANKNEEPLLSAVTEPPKLSTERILRRSGENINHKLISLRKTPMGRYRSYTDPAVNEHWKQRMSLYTEENADDDDTDSDSDSDSLESETSSQFRRRELRMYEKSRKNDEMTPEERIRLENTISTWRANSRSSIGSPTDPNLVDRWSFDTEESRAKKAQHRPFSHSTRASTASNFSYLDEQQKAYVENVLRRARNAEVPDIQIESPVSTLRRNSTSAQKLRRLASFSVSPPRKNSLSIHHQPTELMDGRPVIVHQHYHVHYDQPPPISSSASPEPNQVGAHKRALTGLKRFLPTLRGSRSFSDNQKVRRGVTPTPTLTAKDSFPDMVRAIVENTHKNDPNLSFSLPVLEAADWAQISEVLVSSVQAKATEKLTERAKEASAHLARNQEQIRAVINVLEEDTARRSSSSPVPRPSM